MPELPEVETVRRALAPELTGLRVDAAWSHPSGKFTPALDALGSTFTEVRRRGKYLLVGTDDGTELIVHLGMTGQLLLKAPSSDQSGIDDPYVRASWNLEPESGAPSSARRLLIFRDVRRFGRLRVVPTGDYSSIATLHELGPEPFGDTFDGDEFHRALKASSRRIKTQLLSQRPVAGVGNIYADEALWIAQVHPGARTLSKPRAHRLRDAIEEVMTQGVANGGTTLRDYRTPDGGEGSNQFHLRCYGRYGEPCDRCGDVLIKRTYDARTTTLCPTCQPR